MAEEESCFPPHQRRFVLIAAIVASSMGFIDGSVVSIAVPAIRINLGASLSEAQWVSNAYLLFLSALTLTGGAVGDRFGLRRVFALGIAFFTLASAACALAPTPFLLIVSRALQGVGAALMVPGSLAIIAKAYPRAERGKAIGIWAAASSVTTIAGPILGGLLLTGLGEGSWRLVFAINLPLGILALFLLFTKVAPDRASAGRRLDLIGAVLASLSLLLIAYGLTGDGTESVPPLSHTIGWSAAGIALAAMFFLWESRAKAPMLPLRLFKSKSFSGANALTFVLYFGLGGVMFFLPMTMIGGWGVSPAEVSLALLPMGLVLTVLSSFSGRWADQIGPGPLLTLGSLTVAMAFLLLGLTAPLQQVWLAVFPSIALLGLGMGLVVSPLSTAVMTSVGDGDTGIASGINNAVARVAGLFAVAVLGSVVADVFQRHLGLAAELQIFFGLAAEGLSPAQEAVRLAATNAAFAFIPYITAGLSALAALIAWFTLERRWGPVSSPAPRQPAQARAPSDR